MRAVFQLMPNLSFGDAVSQDALAIKRVLREMGIHTEIFARYIDPRLISQCRPIKALRATRNDVLLFHHSIGTPLAERFLRHRGPRWLRYHNITPAAYFMGYNPALAHLTSLGRHQLPKLARISDLLMGASEFSCRELIDAGGSAPKVVPVFTAIGDLDGQPSDPVLDWQMGDGCTNVLFVGRVVPNKRQDDVVRVFARYHRFVDRNSRLILVGRTTDLERYAQEVRAVADGEGVASALRWMGHTTAGELATCYRRAHLFLSMSEHEGFCVPLLEAMHFGVPILAFAAGAVPDTMGHAGILFRRKDHAAIAEMMHIMADDEALRKQVIARQHERLASFGEAQVALIFREAVRPHLD